MRRSFVASDGFHTEIVVVKKIADEKGFNCVFEVFGNEAAVIPKVHLISMLRTPCEILDDNPPYLCGYFVYVRRDCLGHLVCSQLWSRV